MRWDSVCQGGMGEMKWKGLESGWVELGTRKA